MTENADDPKADAPKKERSPSFPYISLRKAVERARSMLDRYKREPARVIVVGSVWGLGAKSSGLQQTVAALKQYGLLHDSGSKEDRKVTLTPLALRILIDTRPGQREDGLREAAIKPRLFNEYQRWAAHRPPDDHVMSELRFDRGFTEEAAKTFIRVFFDTMDFAGVGEEYEPDAIDELALSEPTDAEVEAAAARVDETLAREAAVARNLRPPSPASYQAQILADAPLAERIKIQLSVGAIEVAALVRTPAEADVLIQFIQANKALLGGLPDVL
jgi:hypothetical protein